MSVLDEHWSALLLAVLLVTSVVASSAAAGGLTEPPSADHQQPGAETVAGGSSTAPTRVAPQRTRSGSTLPGVKSTSNISREVPSTSPARIRNQLREALPTLPVGGIGASSLESTTGSQSTRQVVRNRSRRSNETAPGSLEWQFDSPTAAVYSSPTVVEGTAYIGSMNGTVYAVDVETGKEQWRFTEPAAQISGSPTVADDTVYVGSWDTTLYAIDADTGEQLWTFEEPSNWLYSSPTVMGGTVYVGSFDSTLYAVDTDTGEQRWAFNGERGALFGEPFGPISSSPVVVNRTVYVGSSDGTLRAIDAWSGHQEWSFETPTGGVASSPTVANGTIYVGANDKTLYAIDATTGTQEWSFDAPTGAIYSSPTVAGGTVYVGANDNTFYAVDAANGTQRWTFDDPTGSITSSPTVADGTVYVGANDDTLYAVDADSGTQQWASTAPSGSVRSSPIVLDGTVYVGAGDGSLYAVHARTEPVTSDGSRATQRSLGHISRCPELELQDTSNNCIPDIVAEADLRIPAGSPLAGEPLELDPTTRDTSGNGIEDHVLVDIEYDVSGTGNNTTVDATVTEALAHPNRTDSDGDGLSDRQEFEGRTITYANSQNATIDFLAEIKATETREEINRIANKYLITETVQSSPLREDTDGDGLDDPAERRLGTDPRAVDTTGDGAPDNASLTTGYDPTLFDLSRPQITVRSTDFEKPSGSLDGVYEVSFVVKDPLGVRVARLRRDGNLEKSLDDIDSGEQRLGTINVSGFETVGDLYSGTTITVEAEDEKGNTAKVVAREQSDLFGVVSDKLRQANLSNQEFEESLGVLSGFTTGAGETGDSLAALYNNPLAFIQTIRQLEQLVRNLDEVIEALPAQIKETQRENNPNPAGTNLNESYASGWYRGYLEWFIVEALVPGSKLTKALKSSKRLQTVVDTLETDRVRKIARFAKRAKYTASTPKRVARYQLSRGLAAGKGLSQQAAQRVLQKVPTVGRQLRTSGRLRADLDLDELSETQQRRLGETLAASDPATGRALGRMDDEALGDLLDLDVDAKTRAELAPAYSTLDAGGQQRARELIDQQGAAGVRLVSKLDADSAPKVLELPCTPGRSSIGSAGAAPVHALTQSCDISDEEWDAYAKTLEEASKELDGDEMGKTADVIRDTKKKEEVLTLFDEPDNPEGVVRFVANADTDTVEHSVLIDTEATFSFGEWDGWRKTMFAYFEKSSIDTDELNNYIDDTYEVTTDPKIDDSKDLVTNVERLNTGIKKVQPGRFREISNEVARARAYAEGVTDFAPDRTAQNIKLNKEFPNKDTNADIDMKVEYEDGSVEYVELKRPKLSPTNDKISKQKIESNLIEDAVEKKYEAIGDGTADGKNIVQLDMEIGDTTENAVQETIEDILQDYKRRNGEIPLDEVRVTTRDTGDSFSIDVDPGQSESVTDIPVGTRDKPQIKKIRINDKAPKGIRPTPQSISPR